MQIGFQLFTFEPMFVFLKIFVRIQLIFRMDNTQEKYHFPNQISYQFQSHPLM